MEGYRKSLPRDRASEIPPLPTSDDWNSLCNRATRIVAEIIAGLSESIAAEARLVPCLFKERADSDSQSPRYRTLGEYHNFIAGRKSDYNGPIFLYLRAIEDSCAARKADFDAEVKFVFLHELGHHFGWDEVDLVRHGLPSGRRPELGLD